MAAIQVDTLKTMTNLEAGGFSPEQARTMATVMGDVFQVADLVTWKELEPRLQLLEQRIVIRLGAMLVVAIGVIVAAMRFFGH